MIYIFLMEVKIYGTDDCPYCVGAKGLFNTNDIKFDFIYTNTAQGEAKRKELAVKYNWKTIPMIFIGNSFIGGFDDLRKKIRDKEIDLKKLAEQTK